MPEDTVRSGVSGRICGFVEFQHAVVAVIRNVKIVVNVQRKVVRSVQTAGSNTTQIASLAGKRTSLTPHMVGSMVIRGERRIVLKYAAVLGIRHVEIVM